jgi:hypothetical protein
LRAIHFQQHVSQHLSCRQRRFAFADLVLMVGHRAQQGQGFIIVA